jgi:pyruvate formate lyase activating enzyme
MEPSSVYAYLEKPSMVDYPGHFAAIFFVSGCNFTCGFCHNADLMGKKQAGLSFEKLEAACQKFKANWVNAVVVTGGEPTLAPDLPELLQFFKSFGFAVKLDTNGSNPQMLEKCLPLVDYVAMDIKAGFSLYPDFVGFSKIETIQKSIALLQEKAKDYEFRTTIIESIHTDEQVDEMAQLISGAKRYVLQAFIPREELPGKAYRTMPRTTSARLSSIKNRLKGTAQELVVRGE